MKKLIILTMAAGFAGTSMIPTEALARRGGSLKTAPKHHEFAAAKRATAAPVADTVAGKARVRAPKIRLIKVHGTAVGFTFK